MKKLFKSLRLRLILLILLVGIIPIATLHIIIINTYEQRLVSSRQLELRQQFNVLSSELGKSDSVEEALTDEMRNILDWYSEVFGGRILVINECFSIVHDTFSADMGKTCISDAVFSAFNGNDAFSYDKNTHHLEYTIPVVYTDGNTKNVYSVLVISSTTEWIHEGVEKVEEIMEIVELILFILLVLGALYVSYLITRPIDRVSYQIHKFHNGHFEGAVNRFKSYTEVDSILTSASDVIEQYKRMEESQEQFVSNVSHELRTPITSVKVLSDSLLGQEGLPEEVYQEFLNDISVEINRESNMIDDLLSMSRLGNDQNTLNITTVNMNEFLMEILKIVKPIAINANVELVYESFRQVSADIDSTKLNQAFLNLVENGIKYNNDGGTVKVSLDADHEFFYVRIQDNGIGIPQDSIPHIFDRFYRVDKDRSRETGGTGLGLPIAKQIIQLHNGLIKVESKQNEGTTFTVRIPLKRTEGGNL